MYDLVIFDLDGTLLNTIEDLGHAANYALEKNGFATHSMASYRFFVGNGVRRLITRVLPEDERDSDTVDMLLRDFTEYYDEHNTDFTKPYAGIPELTRMCGWPWRRTSIRQPWTELSGIFSVTWISWPSKARKRGST